jgi:hypothetical protein
MVLVITRKPPLFGMNGPARSVEPGYRAMFLRLISTKTANGWAILKKAKSSLPNICLTIQG